MTNIPVPIQPPQSFRVVLNLKSRQSRMDNTLLAALKDQKENLDLRNISRGALKELFSKGQIQIKGQKATPSSALAVGVTYVDILGF